MAENSKYTVSFSKLYNFSTARRNAQRDYVITILSENRSFQ